ncbi:MAG: hypothetical protein AAGI11_17420 [Pseudomonadota bacterium]
MSEKLGPGSVPDWRQSFIERHELPGTYRAYAQKWFDPLVEILVARQNGARGPLLVGLNGSQGSGKTTLADYLVFALEQAHQLSAISLSLDDFYLPLATRAELADTIHPLLRTRGVAGTHDLGLMKQTLDRLGHCETAPVPLPAFDKAIDDRVPSEDWLSQQRTPDLIVLEGWCLGARPEPADALQSPLNDLESQEDPDGVWRQYVNNALEAMLPVYEQIDYWVMLQAPSFECVFDWRCQQEAQLARHRPGASGIMDEQALQRFVQHFQRLTLQCLRDLPERVDYLLRLDASRDVLQCMIKPAASR